MAKESKPYAEKKKIISAIAERRLSEDITDLLKEYKISSSTFYTWREEVTNKMKKNKKSNSYKKDKKGKGQEEGLNFCFDGVDMPIDSGVITFEKADVIIDGKDVYFEGTGVIRKD